MREVKRVLSVAEKERVLILFAKSMEIDTLFTFQTNSLDTGHTARKPR